MVACPREGLAREACILCVHTVDIFSYWYTEQGLHADDDSIIQ
jgi:hypothetical protein